MNTYWGEMHTHTFCGRGKWRSIEQAALTAKEHLDFWAPAEHHDHPSFDWDRITMATSKANESGCFIALPGHEVGHINGDFNVYYQSEGPEAYTGSDLLEFFEHVRSNNGIVIPHHTGYKQGCRGMQWEEFFKQDITLLFEIFSMHGCSERDPGPFPMDLAWMGPRESGGCALKGLEMGFRFGFIASSDGHNAYPGTYGMGLAGVKARDLTRNGIFDALRKRRTWAVTGDRIDIVNFEANGSPLGSDLAPGSQEFFFDVEGLDTLDTIDVIKNGNVIKRFTAWEESGKNHDRFALRICWGWGAGNETEWFGNIIVENGSLCRISPIFGPPAPDTYRVNDNTIEFSSVTAGYNADWTTNRYRCGGECGFSLIVSGDLSTKMQIVINGMEIMRSIGELMKKSEIIFLPLENPGQSWNVPKIKIFQCIPEYRFKMEKAFNESLGTGDFLYLRIRQDNGQMAWTSPVFALL